MSDDIEIKLVEPKEVDTGRVCIIGAGHARAALMAALRAEGVPAGLVIEDRAPAWHTPAFIIGEPITAPFWPAKPQKYVADAKTARRDQIRRNGGKR